MAHYCSSTRSNAFRVRDRDAFQTWCQKRLLDFWIEDTKPGADPFFVIAADAGGFGWPTSDDDDEEINFIAELAAHLDARDVVVLFEVANEELRYLGGVAIGIHPDGRVISLNLEEIYARAREAFGPEISIDEGGC